MFNECNHLSFQGFLRGFVVKVSFLVEFQVVWANHDLGLDHSESIEKYQYFSKVMLRAGTAWGSSCDRENCYWFFIQGGGLDSGDPIEKVLKSAGDRVVVLWWSNYHSICLQYLLVKSFHWVWNAGCFNILVVNWKVDKVENLKINILGFECLTSNLKSSQISRLCSERTTDSYDFVCCTCFNHIYFVKALNFNLLLSIKAITNK